MKHVNVDAVVASGHNQSEQRNVNSYEDRVCLNKKLGEPGDIIFSGHLMQEYKKKYGGDITADNVLARAISCMNMYLPRVAIMPASIETTMTYHNPREKANSPVPSISSADLEKRFAL